MKTLMNRWKCKFCGSTDFKLMDTTLMVGFKDIEEPYYYHYSEDYGKGCRQRINYKKIFEYAEIVKENENI